MSERVPSGLDQRRRVLVIPYTPVSKNVWNAVHWSKRHNIKKEWEHVIWACVNEHPRMPRPLESVRCDIDVFWAKRGPLPDHINLEMSFECVADGLVKAGIIWDDSGTMFERGDLRIFRHKAPGRTEVVLSW